ncbi:MAG TPA: M48 family metallopeptidase [Candidatus Baltobacteraceae bacterium]|nr:M48 family metallopeptidase [Candidatus Baltobacteraceae bacterium]
MNRLAALITAAALALACIAPAYAYTQEEQTEQQIGQQEYQQLQQKGEIIASSPYYNILNPIAQRIAAVADRQYFVPFHFILVNEKDPNAFAVPGGNVYVTTAMMHFVKNKEELAGVLCHETSHDIHHDVYNLYAKDQRLSLYAGIASILFGRNSGLVNGLINIGANLQALHFSRDVEENADHKGAITCAQAGFTPWGMVWLMQAFQNSNMQNPPEFLSDHPSDAHRIDALENEFASDPSMFSNFNRNESCATPLAYSGFYDQYAGGCGARRQQQSTYPSMQREM